jgi:hypothetical protein
MIGVVATNARTNRCTFITTFMHSACGDGRFVGFASAHSTASIIEIANSITNRMINSDNNPLNNIAHSK